ncbi:MAG: pyridoxamine 5'-phosphate oxidase family protein [Candidatus Omnitrophota bacterium]
MAQLTEGIIRFFQHQPYTVISTIDETGHPHNSCKGIVDIEESNKVYLMDLYKGKTYSNLKRNPKVSITAVDEHKFMGFSLKGKAKIVDRHVVPEEALKKWEDKILKRISSRLIKNIKGEKGHPRHPESLLPKPEYLIEVEIEDIVDLTPHNIKGA